MYQILLRTEERAKQLSNCQLRVFLSLTNSIISDKVLRESVLQVEAEFDVIVSAKTLLRYFNEGVGALGGVGIITLPLV